MSSDVFELSGIDDMKTYLRKLKNDVAGTKDQGPINTILHKTAVDMRNEWQRLVRQNDNTGATGAYLKQIHFENESTSNMVIYSVGSGVSYAQYVEYGTSPHFPPFEALVKWVQVHIASFGGKTASNARKGKTGLARDRILAKARSIAFLVARKISQKGTKEHPAFRPAFEKTAREMEAKLSAYWGSL